MSAPEESIARPEGIRYAHRASIEHPTETAPVHLAAADDEGQTIGLHEPSLGYPALCGPPSSLIGEVDGVVGGVDELGWLQAIPGIGQCNGVSLTESFGTDCVRDQSSLRTPRTHGLPAQQFVDFQKPDRFDFLQFIIPEGPHQVSDPHFWWRRIELRRAEEMIFKGRARALDLNRQRIGLQSCESESPERQSQVPFKELAYIRHDSGGFWLLRRRSDVKPQ